MGLSRSNIKKNFFLKRKLFLYFLILFSYIYYIISLSDIAILNIKGSDYRCIISLISKNDINAKC